MLKATMRSNKFLNTFVFKWIKKFLMAVLENMGTSFKISRGKKARHCRAW
jgi:hypothetical protein